MSLIEAYRTILEQAEAYFEGDMHGQWTDKIGSKNYSFDHDEPTVTFMGLFSIFGTQGKLTKAHSEALVALMSLSGFRHSIAIDGIKKVTLEKRLKEIVSYKKYIYKLLNKGSLHMYPDKISKMNKRLKKRVEGDSKNGKSMEGNTNLDAFIAFSSGGEKKHMFIESKFLSDVSTHVTYNPVRNQIIRNIDAMIDFALSDEGNGLENTYFALLTPKVFRTHSYGGNKRSLLNDFNPQFGRYYCYLMERYRDPEQLRKDLPHRYKLNRSDWKVIADRIGWMTFEDLVLISSDYKLNDQYESVIETFFEERNLLEF